MNAFRNLVLAAGLLLLAAQPLMALESPKSKEELMERFKTGLSEKNVDLLYGLFYMEGVSEDTKTQMKSALGVLVNSELTGFSFAEVPAGYDPVRVTPAGIKIAPNMDVLGFIKFNIKSAEGWEGTGSQPYGSIAGVYYLPGSLIK